MPGSFHSTSWTSFQFCANDSASFLLLAPEHFQGHPTEDSAVGLLDCFVCSLLQPIPQLAFLPMLPGGYLLRVDSWVKGGAELGFDHGYLVADMVLPPPVLASAGPESTRFLGRVSLFSTSCSVSWTSGLCSSGLDALCPSEPQRRSVSWTHPG